MKEAMEDGRGEIKVKGIERKKYSLEKVGSLS